MKIIETTIPDLVEIDPQVFGDKRGYFFESYNHREFVKNGLDAGFVQDNQSLSDKGVLRGLHFQNPPHAQGKLVRVITGAVLDVAVDIRRGSPTYGHFHKVVLSGENKKMFWIPEGFAHGFLTLEDNTIFSYKCTHYYNREAEGALLWNDKDLEIEWDIEDPVLSEKDRKAERFAGFRSQFVYKGKQASGI